jgi:hypothetical protein
MTAPQRCLRFTRGYPEQRQGCKTQHGTGPAVAGSLVMGWSYGPALAAAGGAMTPVALAFYLLVSDPAPVVGGLLSV